MSLLTRWQIHNPSFWSPKGARHFSALDCFVIEAAEVAQDMPHRAFMGDYVPFDMHHLVEKDGGLVYYIWVPLEHGGVNPYLSLSDPSVGIVIFGQIRR